MAVLIPWNKGLTKTNHLSLGKIAEARRKQNNFLRWYQKRKIVYAPICRSSDVAELYGTMLGDGCIEKFPRTEKLVISFNAKEHGHIRHIAELVEKLFKKTPSVRVRKECRCVDVYFYQKGISARLDFPTGEKLKHKLLIPKWIKSNKVHLVRCLKGLFETDGDWVIDGKYNTNVAKFTNVSTDLLSEVFDALVSLGFRPWIGKKNVSLARRAEVYQFVKLIKFRQYK